MSTFSPSDAAFEGFRLTRERPRMVLIWAAVSFLVSLVTLPLLISSGLGKAMMLAEQGSDPVVALMQGGPAYLGLVVVGLVVQSVFVAAVYRAVLRPQDSRFAYLRLGMDEVRQVALFFVLLAILMVAVFLIVLIGGVVSAVATGALNAAGGGQGLAALATLAVSLWVVGLVVFVVVRLSLSLPMTFAQGRVRVFAAWRLTRGSFWRLTGAYFLAMVLLVVVGILTMIIFSALAATIGALQGLDLADALARFNADTSSIQAYFNVPTLIGALVNALLSAIYYVVMVSPSAVAYQALMAERGEEARALPTGGDPVESGDI